jgi:hypothetical protein
MANVGIKDSWTLMAFARMKGKMQVGNFANSETGETFKSCVFTNTDGERCFVSFSSNLGELTPSQISAQKNDLQVVELVTGNYKLCKQGENNWEDVVL